MRTHRSATFVSICLVALTGCASTAGFSSGRNPDLITADEMRPYTDYSALEMIRQFRPNWLNDRGAGVNPLGVEDIANPQGIRVYLDGVEQPGGLRELEGIPVQQISEMRKLDASDATQRFGVGHSAGAIIVTTISEATAGKLGTMIAT